MQQTEQVAKHRLDDEMRRAAAAAKRERDKRQRYREEAHGARLDAMNREQVLTIAGTIGRECGAFLAAKLNGRRTWRNLLTANDRRLLLAQIEKDHYATATK